MPRSSSQSSPARWAKEPTPSERAAELAEQERLTSRDIRHAFLQTIGGCFLSLATGLSCIGYGLHTMDPAFGQIAFLGGLLVGYVGITVSLALYYLKGERSGWWA
jgi:hypothetical protein